MLPRQLSESIMFIGKKTMEAHTQENNVIMVKTKISERTTYL